MELLASGVIESSGSCWMLGSCSPPKIIRQNFLTAFSFLPNLLLELTES